VEVLDRYGDIVRALQRRATQLGLAVKPEYVPDDPQYPIIFTCTRSGETELCALIFLFVPGDLFFTSDIVSFVFERIRSMGGEGVSALLLFDSKVMPRVQRVLSSVKLDDQAATAAYTFSGYGYSMDWELPEAPASGEK
jgi:hypothetical protein